MLQAFLALLLALPRTHKPRHVPQPEDDELRRLWLWVEDHGDIVFPVVAALVVGLLVYGFRHGIKSSGDEARRRHEQKDAIIRMMRAHILVSADTVAETLKVDRFRAGALLEELVREGKLLQQRMSNGIVHYRLKGL